ncbi:MAG: LLM class flavin-dependent oxidoreductase [Actinobacteria bacterium]|nr:LLM class flavin-dependent oxidoreductase [Actinomycetota bacterium]
MRVGVGLPGIVPGAEGDVVLEWARRADSGPFSSLGTIDRLAYGNQEAFAMLAAAAAVTSRVRLVTMAVIAPLRPAALLAKEAATVDRLSGGRLVLGLATGARQEDYMVAGVDGRGRGPRFSEQLVAIRSAWEEGTVGPRPAREGGPPILVGGSSGPAFARMARLADGYVHGGGPPRAFANAAARALAAWSEAERPGRPDLWGQAYFTLGDGGTVERGAMYLRDYYAFTGPFAEKIAAGNLTTSQAIVDLYRGYEDAGCDELVLLPTVASLDQVDRLAQVLA